MGIGGFRHPEHVVRGATQPHDSAGLGVPTPALALPCAGRGPAPRTHRARAVLLQLPATAPSPTVRVRDANSGDACRTGEHLLDLVRRLFCGRFHHRCCYRGHQRLGDRLARGIWRRRSTDSVFAVGRAESRLISSERRKHPALTPSAPSGPGSPGSVACRASAGRHGTPWPPPRARRRPPARRPRC